MRKLITADNELTHGSKHFESLLDEVKSSWLL